MIGIKVHSSLPLRKGTRDCVVSTQSVCAAGTSEPVLILKVLMCTLLNINSQTPSDLRQGQSTCNDPLRLRRLLSARDTRVMAILAGGLDV